MVWVLMLRVGWFDGFLVSICRFLLGRIFVWFSFLWVGCRSKLVVVVIEVIWSVLYFFGVMVLVRYYCVLDFMVL